MTCEFTMHTAHWVRLFSSEVAHQPARAARLRLNGAEVVVTLSALIAEGDFEEYGRFHAAHERKRPYPSLIREMPVSGPDQRRHSKRTAPFSVCFGSPRWCGAACRVRREEADRHGGE